MSDGNLKIGPMEKINVGKKENHVAIEQVVVTIHRNWIAGKYPGNRPETAQCGLVTAADNRADHRHVTPVSGRR
jgi:hypothetical protein